VDDRLETALQLLARAPVVLVASDFDGTLAPIVARPEDAAALPEAAATLRELAELRQTTVAVISGRARADLVARSGLGDPVRLVGSHGYETGDGVRLSAEERGLCTRIREAMTARAETVPGARVEPKPAGAAFHYRHARSDDARRAVADLRRDLARENVWLLDGKEVLEAAAVPLDKGAALRRLRHAAGVDAVLFVGDDATDELVFACLEPQDVGVKVGEGTSRAQHRVADPAAVVALLHRLVVLRSAYVEDRVREDMR
jgi:trehalose-phosphatase